MWRLVEAHDNVWVEPLDIFALNQSDVEQFECVVSLHLIILTGELLAYHVIFPFISCFKVENVSRIGHLLCEIRSECASLVFNLIKQASGLSHRWILHLLLAFIVRGCRGCSTTKQIIVYCAHYYFLSINLIDKIGRASCRERV